MPLAITRVPGDPPIVLVTPEGERIVVDVEQARRHTGIMVVIDAPRDVRIFRGEPGTAPGDR